MLPPVPDVSIVIPCRDHSAELVRCLQTLQSQAGGGDVEIVVVDAGLDDAVGAVARRHALVRVVRGGQRLLPGAARNLGAANARGRLLCFIDADCTAETGWLAAAADALGRGARLVGGPVLHGEPWHPIATIDNLMQFSDVPASRPAGPSQLLPSCNLAMSREDFQELGGYPALDFPAGEDGLFCNRAAARWPGALVFVPAMRVRHFGRNTLQRLWTHQRTFGQARARYGLEVTPAYRRLGRTAMLAPVVALRRIAYMAMRAIQWAPVSLVALVFGFPILVFGMAAWCRGFYLGSQSPAAAIPVEATGSNR
jgi:glycosyltransferase involved in cell wall biosynthesis